MEPTRVRGLRGYANETNIGGDWSVSLESCSLTLGAPNASQGGIDFSSAATRNSSMATGKVFRLVDSRRGEVEAVSSSASVDAGVVSIGGDGLLNKFNTDRTMAGFSFGHTQYNDTTYGRVETYAPMYNYWDMKDYGLGGVDWKFMETGTNAEFGYFQYHVFGGNLGNNPVIAVFSGGGALLWSKVFTEITGQMIGIALRYSNSDIVFSVAGVGVYNLYITMQPEVSRDFPGVATLLPLSIEPSRFVAARNGGNTLAFANRTTGGQTDRQLFISTQLSGASGVVNVTDSYPNVQGLTPFVSSSTSVMAIYSSNTSSNSTEHVGVMDGPAGSQTVRSYSSQSGTLVRSASENVGLGPVAGMYLHAFDGSFYVASINEQKFYLVNRLDQTSFPNLSNYVNTPRPGVSGAPIALGYASVLLQGGIVARHAYMTNPVPYDLLEHSIGSVRPYTGFSLENYNLFPYNVSNYSETPFVPWSGDVWTNINEWAQVNNLTVTPRKNYLVINTPDRSHNSREKTQRIKNTSSVPVDVQTGSLTRYVAIEALNAVQSSFSNFYNAASDDEATFSIRPGEVVEESIAIDHYPVWLGKMFRTNQFPAYTNEGVWGYRESEYFLIASDNLPVAAGQFEDYGGSVTARISDEQLGTIILTLTGPRQEIPGVPSPYTIGISDGEVTRGALSIMGSGVKTAPSVEVLSTGADWSITSEEVNETPIKSPYLTSKRIARQRGYALADRAGMPTVTLSLSMSALELVEFGLAEGTVHVLNDGLWRIISSRHGSDGVTFTFEQFASSTNTSGQDPLDEIWWQSTYEEFERVWAGLTVGDFAIEPLRGPGSV